MGKKQPQNIGPLHESFFSKHGIENFETSYPSLWKVFQSSDSSLLDISAIQMELERILASVMERLICLKCESSGKGLPPSLHSSLINQKCSNDIDSLNQPQTRPSLVVKANPDKPLTLIISQRGHTQNTLQTIASSTSRSKSLNAVPNLRKNSRSSLEDIPENKVVDSPDKNPSTSSYAIPNKFWELMEPYCAEITEANINYLEELIRSYQELESSYFHLPPLKPGDVRKVDIAEAPAYKRCKRECTQTAHNVNKTSYLDNPTPFSTASNMVILAKRLENELKKPISEVSTLGRVAQSLLESCYKDDVHMDLIQKNINSMHKVSNHLGHDGAHYDSSSVTSNASQPLKTLAKQLHVSTSYRLEKKVAQSVEQLGLFPIINLNDSTMHPDPVDRVTSSAVHTNNSDGDLLTTPQSNKSPIQNCTGSNKSPFSASSSPRPVNQKNSSTRLHHRVLGHITNNNNNSNNDNNNNDNSNNNGIDTITCQASFDNEKSRCKKAIYSPVGQLKTKLIWRPNKSNRISIKKKLRALHYKNKLRNSITQSGKPNTQSNKLVASINLESHLQNSMNESMPNGFLTPDMGAGNGDEEEELMNEPRRTKTFGSTPNSSSGLNHNHLSNNDDDDDDVEEEEDDDDEGDDVAMNEHDEQIENEEQDVNVSGNLSKKSILNHRNINSHLLQSPNPTSPSQHEIDFVGHCFKSEHDILLESNTHLNFRNPAQRTVLLNGNLFDGMGQNWASVDNDDILTERFKQTAIMDVEQSHEPNDTATTTELEHNRTENSARASLGLRNLKDESVSNFEHLGTNQVASPRHSTTSSLNHQISKISQQLTDPNSVALTAAACGYGGDEIGWAITQRQQELRLLCATNHNTLRRLVQAARRDMQRQEIQRRLAIADADVIEAYNRLEAYRPQRKTPLKRDRDMAWKALKERRKILKELEAFDSKSP